LAVVVESCVVVGAGFVESWIGVVDPGVAVTWIHDSANRAGSGVAAGGPDVVGMVGVELRGPARAICSSTDIPGA
jgi:hypothetical protein